MGVDNGWNFSLLLSTPNRRRVSKESQSISQEAASKDILLTACKVAALFTRQQLNHHFPNLNRLEQEEEHCKHVPTGL